MDSIKRITCQSLNPNVIGENAKKADESKSPILPEDSFKPSEQPQKRKLVLLQIDGLSHSALKFGISQGMAPNIKKLLDSKKYVIQPFQCGIATVTIPVLAGLFYGVELPGNDWYDKETKEFVDGIEYESKLREDLAAKGERGVLNPGAAYSSPLSGGSSITGMVVNPLKESQKKKGTLKTLIEEAKTDIALLKKGGHSLTKAGWNFIKDIFKARAWMKKEGVLRTKLDKLAPILMSLNHNVIEKVACEGIKKAIEDGLPVAYADFAAYDEKAHYFGPKSKEAMDMLKTIDDSIGQIVETAQKSKDKYEVLVFSDHGQTPSKLFEDLFKVKPGDMIVQYARNVAAAYGREFKDDDIVFTDAYSLGNIYFNFDKKRVDLDAVEKHHPTLIDFLKNHPGIGLVVGTQNGSVIMMGKEGTLEITPDGKETLIGKNPLVQYGDENVIKKQIVDYMSLEKRGDVVIFGLYDQDKNEVVDFNTKYSLKSLHGGIGGDQIKPFIIGENDIPIQGSEITEAKQLHELYEKYRQYIDG